MKIGKKDCRNLDRALSLEWLETNARGGFASGTVAADTRATMRCCAPTAKRSVSVGQSRRGVAEHRRRDGIAVHQPVSGSKVSRWLYPLSLLLIDSLADMDLCVSRQQGSTGNPVRSGSGCRHRPMEINKRKERARGSPSAAYADGP